jgi:hypothetical protein
MKLAAAVLAAALVAPTLAIGVLPAAGAPAQHDVYVEEYDAYEPFDAGENPCVDWAGTFHEVRAGQAKLVSSVGDGPSDEGHVNGVVDGFVELIPDDATLPSYSGTYREKLNVLVTISGQADDLLIAQYRLRSVLTGTDGSRLTMSLSGKITVNGRGDVVISRDEFTCA